MDINRACFGCFSEKSGNICPYCGYDSETGEHPFLALPVGTILGGRYITGKVLGMGGFGITYLGFDLTLEIKVAIKEYMPTGIATRHTDHYNITLIASNDEQNYRGGEERFLDEARILAKLQNVPNIVTVQNYFRENNTAYFVMDFVEGMSLKEFLKNQGGKIPYEQALTILLPVMEALMAVHAQSLMHRDISPDNIYITKEGKSKLLDFGAARFALGDEKSISVILKHGYAPEEQYRSRGNQGPWTDVYAMGATLYYSITGVLPPDSIERLHADTMAAPSGLGVKVPVSVEKALMKALSVKAEDRFANMESFIGSLTGRGSMQQQVQSTVAAASVAYTQPASAETGSWAEKVGGPFKRFLNWFLSDKKRMIFVSASALVLILAIVLPIALLAGKNGGRTAYSGGSGGGSGSGPGTSPGITAPGEETPKKDDATDTTGVQSPGETQPPEENDSVDGTEAGGGTELPDDTPSSDQTAPSTETQPGESKGGGDMPDSNGTKPVPETEPSSTTIPAGGAPGQSTLKTVNNYPLNISLQVPADFVDQSNDKGLLLHREKATTFIGGFGYHSGEPMMTLEEFIKNRDIIMENELYGLNLPEAGRVTGGEKTTLSGLPAYRVDVKIGDGSKYELKAYAVQAKSGYGCYLFYIFQYRTDPDYTLHVRENEDMLKSIVFKGTQNTGLAIYESKNMGIRFGYDKNLCSTGILDNPATLYTTASIWMYADNSFQLGVVIEEIVNVSNANAVFAALEELIKLNSSEYEVGDTSTLKYGTVTYTVREYTYKTWMDNTEYYMGVAVTKLGGRMYAIEALYTDTWEDRVLTQISHVLSTMSALN